ncbi:MAG: LysR family transcriptional regulator [Cypionkella sp.]|uniref:LysR substrate-binding domain-containing protein n=1 Tax=Cypionkella sp. TaxID=2811411 RepID=UPI00260DA3FD|nr:LysR substrate-binding domain-containing protein [Cypionkella sp.]MDB5661154.1 LysR family transcriptional regulator [Cypionkella sp.]
MPLRFTLRQLEYLVAVGECGSIALAAEKVNVSSPSISAAISQLEAEFGLALFVRKHAHGLSLTQGGRQFVAQASQVLTEASKLNELANQITGKVRGPLSVGCLVTFAQMVLPQLRYSFVQAFPEVDFTQIELNQVEIFAALRSASLDIALTYDLDIPADLSFLPLVTLPPYAVMPPNHPLAQRDQVTPRELAEYPMILLDLPLSSDYFLSHFAAINLRPNIVERTRDMGVMQSMVANGFGYSIANIRPLTDAAPDGRRLRYIPLTGPVRPMKLGLALAAGAGISLTVRAFIDHARAEITLNSTPGLHLTVPRTG